MLTDLLDTLSQLLLAAIGLVLSPTFVLVALLCAAAGTALALTQPPEEPMPTQPEPTVTHIKLAGGTDVWTLVEPQANDDPPMTWTVQLNPDNDRWAGWSGPLEDNSQPVWMPHPMELHSFDGGAPEVADILSLMPERVRDPLANAVAAWAVAE